ncbi:hypothetical protein ABZ484_00630 [Streptomyces sp. NPDC006393]|uniref:hypothetical protein n=1 Tax=Streptomyces sp. NPDC006393 TaxID=3156763 RepID=UPI0033CDBD7D
MQVRGRRLRFTAVLAIVVLALTGFSRGHGHSHSHHSGGGGGGCSSSHQDHDSSSSTSGGGSSYDDSYGDTDDDDSYGSSTTSGSTSGGYYNRRRTPTSTPSGGSNGTTLREGTAKLISCATEKRPYATVEITNPNSRTATFQARVTFYNAVDTNVASSQSPEVSVPAKGKVTVRVPLTETLLASVDHCEADPEAQLRS